MVSASTTWSFPWWPGRHTSHRHSLKFVLSSPLEKMAVLQVGKLLNQCIALLDHVGAH